MAFQIRRAHRFLPPPQDLIALRTSNRLNRGKPPGTLSSSSDPSLTEKWSGR